MNPEKVLRAYFNGKDYYPFDKKWVWIKGKDKWTVVPCPDELMYTEEDGLVEINLGRLLLDFPTPKEGPCDCDPKSLLDFGCQCGGD